MTRRHRQTQGSSGLFGRLVVRPWDYYIGQTLRETERQSAEALAERKSVLDWRTITVCVVVAVNLTLLQYFGLSNRISALPDALRWVGLEGAARDVTQALYATPYARLYSLLYWVAACVFLDFVIPAAIVRLVFRQTLREYGLGLKGSLKHFKVYVVLFLIVAPLILIASRGESFQRQYPFYKDYVPGRLPPGFALWELAYALQFFALEFFFRGFMVHGLKRRFGAYAVFAMMVPYCMIHFGKPFPETLGAIVAGFVLGFLSLRTQSIWLGFMIHVSVALGMDLAALSQQGIL